MLQRIGIDPRAVTFREFHRSSRMCGCAEDVPKLGR